jgi:hypothetical protein
LAAFDDWLRWLKSAKKGPVTLSATRGRAFGATIILNADYTGATLAGQIRLGPDANGAPLESFTCSAPIVASGTTTFDISLSDSEVASLPAAPSGDGYTELAYDLLLTPSGDTEELLFGGTFSLGGRITE